MDHPEYTYGTDLPAALRLKETAEFFNPLATKLIEQVVEKAPETAVDLGCGPGFTTNMLADATKSRRTYGFDASDEFLGFAARNFPHCTFLQHDVTSLPFPLTADIMYTRFVLCHLKKPLEVINAWLSQLRPDGLLVIDELDGIDTELDVFDKYLSTAEGILGSRGGRLYIGLSLAREKYDAEILLNECTVLPVDNAQAASWFFPNTQTIWCKNRYALQHVAPEERRLIGEALYQLKVSKNNQSDITWRLRRIVLKKRDPV